MDTVGVAVELPRETVASVGELAVNDELTDGQLLAQFVECGDKIAFEVLVRRHAPMIMGVCRRALRSEHAAEDAVQAVFVVLLRKAAAIQRPELLANWLYGVAFRIARKARIKAGREHAGEILFEPADERDLPPGPEWREINSVLDEELNQLPARFRLPLVICYLDGKTQVEAARLLGCPCGSVADRLTRARAELRRRLLRRGLVLSVGLLLSLLRHSRASAGVDEELMRKVLDPATHPDLKAARRHTDSRERDRRDSGDGAEPPHADVVSPATDDPASHRKRRRSRAFWLALFWLSVMSGVAIPAYELAGATVARSWGRDAPRLWTQLRAAFSGGSAVLTLSGQDGSVLGTARSDMDERNWPSSGRRLSAEERCKRCLGTQCETGAGARHDSPRRKSLWNRLVDR